MPDGSPAADHWMRVHGGFRADWDLSSRDSLMVQGDLFANQASQTRRSGFMATPFDRIFNQSLDAAGGDVLARWNHMLAGGSQTSLQAYFGLYSRIYGWNGLEGRCALGARFALLSMNKAGTESLSRQPFGLASLGLDSAPLPAKSILI